MKGLPGQNVEIGFNVRFDNGGISYTSVPLPSDRIPREHINFDVTDMDGNFNFQFQLDGGGQPLNHFFNNVGMILGNNNDVTTSISIVQPKTLSDLTNVEYNLNLSDFDMGIGYLPANAIRYLYRARKFVQAVFGYYPNQAYCTFHNGGNLFEVDWFSSVGNIKFNYFYHPSLDVYHEYGHNIHYDVDGLTREILSSECQNHWFYKNTNSECAWTEGWAEFFAAACANYWQKIENSSTFDYYPSRLYQFMDFSQTQLPSGNRESVEGGVASFLYSLLDNYTIRAPNYSGDNEDVHFPATTILYSQNSAVARYHDQYANSPVEGLRDVLIDNMYAENWSQISYRVASLNSLYDAIIKNDGIARSATPTELNIWGDLNTRFLFWNDNTCPTFIDYDEECYTDAHFNLDENQESGFYIYRKAVTDYNWNGYLTGYSLIHTTSANITSWADEELITPGKYSYVVVAFNNEGISIPSAQVTVDCSTLSRVDNLVLTNHNVTLNEFYSATYSITAGNQYTFTIEPWAGATFCAGQEIILKPGFTAIWSSNFLGKIDDCIPCEPGFGSSPSPNIPLNKPDSIDIVIIENNFISCNPNPAYSSIDVVYKLQSSGSSQLIITNSYGQQVYNANVNNVNPTQEQRHSIDISTFPSGLYFVTLRSSAVALTKGVVVLK